MNSMTKLPTRALPEKARAPSGCCAGSQPGTAGALPAPKRLVGDEIYCFNLAAGATWAIIVLVLAFGSSLFWS
jgi:hypothetical protein